MATFTKIRQLMPNTPYKTFCSRGSNAVRISKIHPMIMLLKKFIKESAHQGVDVFRIFDSLNRDSSNGRKVYGQVVRDTGKIAEAANLLYLRDINDPARAKYNVLMLP
ncbi:hypothetical protein ODV97_19430 [Enterococcus gallinarum]|nr:hypothetical protein [Enterococcus gallinarum]